ncbi:hypothetical protein [Clostridium oceanicum]|uniref:DUF5673 domain-containing protein n=1 Tax=Clostridium oceanicum TaxID=1543 RepID=A0ABP3UMA4_9CLOT
MKIMNIFIFLAFISVIFMYLTYIKKIIIPTRKRPLEIIVLSFVIAIFIWIMYSYANVWWHYIFGIVCIIGFTLSCIIEGVTSKGFIRLIIRDRTIILWKQIDKAIVINYPDDVKVKLFGNFMEQTFHFKKSDYDKVINMLHENLPIEAEIQILIGR